MALYRTGSYVEARDTLEKSKSLGHGKYDGFDLYFLAMCHAKLGDPVKARACFDQAVQWRQSQKDLSARYEEELESFQSEAAAMLGGVKP